MTFDLHMHSHFSDGNWSPEELVDEANNQGLKTIALTDHDTVCGIAQAQVHAKKYDIEVIPAVEISTQRLGKDLHILAYFIDPANEALKKLLDEQKEIRIEHVYKLAKSAGVDPSFILNFNVKATIGKAHIAKALVACGAAKDLNEAYFEFLMPKGKNFISRNFVDTKRAVKVLSKSGAIPVLAHPPLDNLNSLIEELKEVGLRGIEAYHALFGHNTERLLALAKNYDLLVTGGSDCHGPYPPFAPQLGGVKMPKFVLENLASSVFEKRPGVVAI